MTTYQNSPSSPIEDGIASYGRIKATMAFSVSSLIATSLIIGGILSFMSSRKNKEEDKYGTVVNINYCNQNNCNVTVKYIENNIETQKQMTASRNVKIGDSIKISNTLGPFGSIGLICVGIILIICGSVYLYYVLNNKYAAIDSAISSQRYYGPYGYGYNPGINITL